MARNQDKRRHTSHLNVDVAKRAESELESVLGEVSVSKEGEDNDEDIDIESNPNIEELSPGKIIFNTRSGRTVSRVLFITTDVSVLEQESNSFSFYESLQNQFDEIHVLVLRPGRVSRSGAIRFGDNIWMYVVAATHWWWLPVEAYQMVKEELVFVSGFRPDLIVARDCFESGATAYWLSKKYSVPVQLHMYESMFASYFKTLKKGNKLRYYLAKYLLHRVKSVRAGTLHLKDELQKRFPNLIDVKVWPKYHDYRAIVEERPEFDVHERFHQYSFIMAYLGNLTYQSTLPKLIDGLTTVLRNPRVGLLIIGSGPAKNEFERKVVKLGIEKQVIFVTRTNATISYMKTANLVLVTDVSSDGDDLMLDAAASGAAIIATKNELREDIFKDSVSAMLCDPGDLACIHESFMTLLDNVAKRKQLGDAAKRAVIDRVHEDHELFKRAIRDSIESVFTVEDVYEITDHHTGR